VNARTKYESASRKEGRGNTDSERLNFRHDELRCLMALNAHDVEYLVVGGYAVRYYGYERATKDLDVLVGNDAANSERVCAAVRALGIHHPNLRPTELQGRKLQINLTDWGFTLEILTGADGIDFPSAYRHRITAKVTALNVPVIAVDDLLTMKRHAARPQDIDDVRTLESRR
jgi:hypothetical protein